jgi:hypothetical protein
MSKGFNEPGTVTVSLLPANVEKLRELGEAQRLKEFIHMAVLEFRYAPVHEPKRVNQPRHEKPRTYLVSDADKALLKEAATRWGVTNFRAFALAIAYGLKQGLFDKAMTTARQTKLQREAHARPRKTTQELQAMLEVFCMSNRVRDAALLRLTLEEREELKGLFEADLAKRKADISAAGGVANYTRMRLDREAKEKALSEPWSAEAQRVLSLPRLTT